MNAHVHPSLDFPDVLVECGLSDLGVLSMDLVTDVSDRRRWESITGRTIRKDSAVLQAVRSVIGSGRRKRGSPPSAGWWPTTAFRFLPAFG